MELYDAMSTLRAVRRLKTDPIPDDIMRRVLLAATWAPSAANRQPWRIIVVRDPETKATLGELHRKRWQDYSETATENLERIPPDARGRTERAMAAGDYLAEHFEEAPAIVVFCFDPDRMGMPDRELARPTVVGGGSIFPAVQNLVLACRAEGLGCCITALICRDEEAIKELLGIPHDWYTAAFVPIGYPRGRGHGPIRRRSLEQMVFEDRWDQPLRIGGAS
ncbi:MAG: nitroreductase family protein [Gammaproteobacteria bacterium]|nr:nitroreductase family protein [Gammaproteobacteria bacterium]